MKFYTSHQIALHSAIADAGYEKSDFSFTKKKGCIIAHYNQNDASFSFIERRESTLDVEKMRLTDKFTYDLVINQSNKIHVSSWDELLENFKVWLSEL